MNNSWIKTIISNFIANNADVFGENAKYYGFETNNGDQNSTKTLPDGFRSIQLYGEISFKDKEGNVHKSRPVIIKYMSEENPTSKFLSFSFTNEINFYSLIIPSLCTISDSFSLLFPKYHHGEMIFNAKGNLNAAIIFEDLKARGYKMATKKSFLDYQHLSLMMRKLGQFHAYSYKAKSDSSMSHVFHTIANNFQETNAFFTMKNVTDILQNISKRGLQYLEQDTKYKQYVHRVEALIQNGDSVCKQILIGNKCNPNSVVIHGDYLRNNVMFRYAKNNIPDDLLIIDMAACRYNSPALDLAMVLYINADQNTRNKYWEQLIEDYYTALKETIQDNEVPSKNAIMAEFVNISFYVYMVASGFLPSLIANDNNIPYPPDIDQDIVQKFTDFKLEEIPREMWPKLFSVVGGEQASQALKDILIDIIDRGFICS